MGSCDDAKALAEGQRAAGSTTPEWGRATTQELWPKANAQLAMAAFAALIAIRKEGDCFGRRSVLSDENRWRRCSACKGSIECGSTYWVCNVSTCNRKRTALVFCSVTCWEVHLPEANHRESWAEERLAPATSG